MAEEMQQQDHDALIRLDGKMTALLETVELHNTASVARDTRIEQAVNKTNGTVKDHDLAIHDLKSRPILPISSDDAANLIAEFTILRNEWHQVKPGRLEMWEKTEKMWDPFTIAKFMGAVFLAEHTVVVAIVIWWLSNK